MAEWLYEAGIGENRAILVADGDIVEAAIELPGAIRVGTVATGRLTIIVPGRRGIVAIGKAGEALLEPLPPHLTDGVNLRVEIVREAVPEPGRPKLPRCRESEAEPREGPTLLQRIEATGIPVRSVSAHDADAFETAGWSELLEEAASGEIGFAGGNLRMSLTPAMTLFDVDGALPPAALAVAGTQATGRAIRRFGIGGSIGIDLPTLPAKVDRQAAAAAFDAVLPQPFERTAVNGFGFLQIVRRRERVSLPELLQSDPVGGAARALLRRAERASGSGTRTLVAAPAVATRIGNNPDWSDELGRRVGARIALRAELGLAISAAYVHVEHP